MPPTPLVPDRAVHSDFLIHWTGKDIDEATQPNWYDENSSKTNEEAESAYRKRFVDILKFGLWMTSEPGIKFGGSQIPETPKCCFTELKLSESRRHARLYGRLGIGVKRPFLFGRQGRPVAYFGFDQASQDPLLAACMRDLKDRDLLNFFKPMNSGKILNYDLYGESEWRILPFAELVETRKIIDPRDGRNVREHEYFESLSSDQQAKLQYLIPLDGWFAAVIYPSLSIKNWAQRDRASARCEIEIIKSREDHANRTEGGNWPLEVHLDSCSHF